MSIEDQAAVSWGATCAAISEAIDKGDWVRAGQLAKNIARYFGSIGSVEERRSEVRDLLESDLTELEK